MKHVVCLQSTTPLNIFLTASQVYLDNGPCCSYDSQTSYFSDQRLNVALGQYETDEILRATAEQVCELRAGSSKNFCGEVLRQTSLHT